MIELNQLGSIALTDSNSLYIHRDPISYNSNSSISKIVDDMMAKLQSKLYLNKKNKYVPFLYLL